MLKGLANETRLAILNCLADGECCVSELAERLGVDQHSISSHLAVLRAQGIVSQRRDGMRMRY
ncbi:MAG: winged helix-turn-helix transcriptional regulator [Armatimonadetes bacterium]|nr:winged helix-turn-helix transcriptional regulator [Armatimonadota bacterium]